MSSVVRRGLVLLVIAALGSACQSKRSEAQVAEGRELFTNACSRCHGAEGTGGLPLWDGGPSPPSFRNHAFQVAHPPDVIRQTIVQGKPPGMPPFGTTFSDAQLAAIIGHVRSLDLEAQK